jgi:hypothetical protein
MSDNNFVYDDGIEAFYFDGEAGGGGKNWKKIELNHDPHRGYMILYKLFDIMVKGRTVMLLRKLHDGSYVSVDTNGKDLQMNWSEWMREYRPEHFAKLNSNDIEP